MPQVIPASRAAFMIGQIAARTGVNLETVRYYERAGLLPPPPRSAGGHRQYGEEQVRRLIFIRRGRELGFTLGEIRALLDLVDGGTQTCAEVKQRTERRLADVRTKIADLRRIEKILASTAAKCTGEQVPDCPVLEALKT